MSPTYGMPFFLEDRSGDVRGGEFVDLYNRMRFSIRCTLRSSDRNAYMIYDHSADSSTSRGGLLVPIGCLDFGANHALGTVKIGDKDHVPMNTYLAKVSRSSKTRRFIASDGQEYRWTHQANADSEYQCLNASGYSVAAYILKPAGEPNYPGSSGCVLTVEEAYQQIAGELLITLMIMRTIAKYNL